MKILGIATEGDSGAVIIEDGRILAAVNEERLCRLKLVVGIPFAAIDEVFELAGVDRAEIDAVMIAANNDHLVETLQPFDGWFQTPSNRRASLRKALASRLAPYRDAVPFLERGYYGMQMPGFLHRRKSLRRIVRKRLGIEAPVRFVDHHVCHLTSAYYTSGFEDALVISLDGGGDGKSSRVQMVKDGRWHVLSETPAYHSLGNYYAYVTHICGFKAQKHEGKITGLAAHGEPRFVPLLREFIDVEEGRLVNRGRVAFSSGVQKLEAALEPGWSREDLAASIQKHFEDVTSRFVAHWIRETGLGDLAVAGGVFANVRVNQVVHELPGVDRIFVHPHMSDGGLACGAALAACDPALFDEPMARDPEPIEDVYLGADLGPAQVAEALRQADLEPEDLDRPLHEEIADLLSQGYVVARAAGRMEYGPRALGNRSILYHPTDPKVNDWLNQNLRRTEFMPFAPSTLYEERERCYENLEGAEHTAEFMTITFDCTPWMRETMKGVVHIDGTARPHLVRKERNPGFHAIIEAFHRRTRLPAIINTSFNMHEEPIVCSADDAVRAFLEGNLDYLAIGDVLVKHPRPITHALVPVEAAPGRGTTGEDQALTTTRSLTRALGDQ